MKLQKRLAAQVIGCSTKRIIFDENRLDDIKEAITKADIKNLISAGSIIAIQKKGISRGRANKRRLQKKKGRSKGYGSRKGKITARGESPKRLWINRVRLQRKFVALLRDKKYVDKPTYKDLYRKIKGGFFRSKGHISVYLEEKGILKAKK